MLRAGNREMGALGQVKYLEKQARNSLHNGDVALAIQQFETAIRLVHRLPPGASKNQAIVMHAFPDHWRVGCCHAELGPSHYGRAISHLKVVCRYFRGIQRKQVGRLDCRHKAMYCRVLAEMARICNLQGRYNLALDCADQGLDCLYRDEELNSSGAEDQIQMMCFAARGDALRGLGHGPEVVVRHCEQVMSHYRRCMADPLQAIGWAKMFHCGKGYWPWSRAQLAPEVALDEMAKNLAEMRQLKLSAPMERLADSILQEYRVWRLIVPQMFEDK